MRDESPGSWTRGTTAQAMSVTCRATSQTKPASSRAMATQTSIVRQTPAQAQAWEALVRRKWARQAMSRTIWLVLLAHLEERRTWGLKR